MANKRISELETKLVINSKDLIPIVDGVDTTSDTMKVKVSSLLNKTVIGLGNVKNLDTTNPENIEQSSSYRFASDVEKTKWNNKASIGEANNQEEEDALFASGYNFVIRLDLLNGTTPSPTTASPTPRPTTTVRPTTTSTTAAITAPQSTIVFSNFNNVSSTTAGVVSPSSTIVFSNLI